MKNNELNPAPAQKPVLPEEDPLLFMGSMFHRAMEVKDETARRQYLGDLVFNLTTLGGAAGAAAHYQPAVFGGLCDDEPDVDKNGQLRKTIHNFLLIFRTAAQFQGVRYNALTGAFEEDGRPWTDVDLSRATAYIEQTYRLKSRDDFYHALHLLQEERSYHPIIERIAAIQWDGRHRLERFFIDYLNCADTPYTREVSRLLFHTAIARLMQPGCKVDNIVILTGRQGSGKSTLVRFLALDDAWFTELGDIRDEKAVGELLRGKWFVELGELTAFRASMEEVKQFVTRQSDRYRLAYDRLAQDNPRTCVFVGTTNNPRPLNDRTGNRRFLPLELCCGGDWLYDNRITIKHGIEQCYAEAYALWQKGEIKPYVTRQMRETVMRQQQAALRDDTRVGDIERYLSDPAANVTTVCIKQLWREALGEFGKPPRSESDFIAAVMDNMPGWKRGEKRISSGEYRNHKCWNKEAEE